MCAQIIDARVKQKTGTAADFAGYTLLEGEIALVRTSPSGRVVNFKVGPGNFDSLEWSLQNPGAAQKADTSTVFPAGVPGLYIPTESGTYEGVTVDLSAGYTQLIWDGSELVKAEFPLDLAGYAKENEVRVLGGAVGVKPLLYSGVRPFRLYTADDAYVTSSGSVTQTDNGDSDTIARVSGSPTVCDYFSTGLVQEVGKNVRIDIMIDEMSGSSSKYVGVGYNDGGTYYGYATTNLGNLVKVSPFTPVNVGTSAPFIEGDVISVISGNDNITFLKNGVKIGEIQDVTKGVVQLFKRGSIKATFSKVVYYNPNFALKETGIITANLNAIYSQYHPFHPNARFVNTESDLSWVKEAIIDVKLYGFPINAKISPFVIRRNYLTTNQYLFSFWQDNGDGSGNPADRVKVIEWLEDYYTPPPSGEIDVIEFSDGMGHALKMYVDWDKVPDGQTTNISYNAAGLSRQALINFNTGATPPIQEAGVEVSWHYNDDDAAVTGTDLFQQFTLMPDTDAGGTIGSTGATYNDRRDEFVIAYYAYERNSKLWIFDRKDLIDYNPVGSINPVPTREIDISSYLYHIQGVAYDNQLNSYWVLGSINPVSNDAERVLIRVDDDGNLLERTELSAYSFQAGMLALSPNGQNLLIKPNNQTWLLEIDKYTKAQVRQVTTATQHEGLGVDAKSGKVWIGGNNGNLYRYDYLTMSLEATIPFQTLADGSSQNIEAIIIDPIDNALLIVADAYLHGGHPNGNGMWVFDFAKTIGKQVRFPDMMPWQGNESVVVDFGSSNDLVPATLEKGTGTIQYRGSNTAPTLPAINRTNWRDRPYYGSWGSTTPSAWSGTMTSYRYMQLRIV